MTSYKVIDKRQCMNELLRKETFDFFLLSEATINTFASYTIDGHRLDGFFTDEELQELGDDDDLMPYEYFREHCFNVIKGNKTPLGFQIILSAPNDIVRQIVADSMPGFDSGAVKLVMMIRYNQGELTVTTGTSFQEFVMDKTIEREFDKWVNNFLTAVGIEFDIII